jgi:hypothetical protein
MPIPILALSRHIATTLVADAKLGCERCPCRSMDELVSNRNAMTTRERGCVWYSSSDIRDQKLVIGARLDFWYSAGPHWRRRLIDS